MLLVVVFVVVLLVVLEVDMTALGSVVVMPEVGDVLMY